MLIGWSDSYTLLFCRETEPDKAQDPPDCPARGSDKIQSPLSLLVLEWLVPNELGHLDS